MTSDKTWRHQSALPATSPQSQILAAEKNTAGTEAVHWSHFTQVTQLLILFTQDSLNDTDSMLAVLAMWKAVTDEGYQATTCCDNLRNHDTDTQHTITDTN